jgi:drug/metabolite transporter (DMT)-like permease
LSSVTASPEEHIVGAERRRRSVFIVVACTLIIPAAQFLIKLGADQLAAQAAQRNLAAAGVAGHAGSVSLQAAIMGIFTNPAIFSGYCLYGIFTVLFVYALRHGELSILYPLISLSYVWVAITAVVAFHEAMNPLKLIGIAIIMAGVTVLGRGGAK